MEILLSKRACNSRFNHISKLLRLDCYEIIFVGINKYYNDNLEETLPEVMAPVIDKRTVSISGVRVEIMFVWRTVKSRNSQVKIFKQRFIQ